MQETEKIKSSVATDIHAFTVDWRVRMNELGKERIPFLFIIDFELTKPVVIPLTALGNSHLQFSMGLDQMMQPLSTSEENNRIQKSTVALATYQTGFSQVMNAIQAGDTYLLNLCYTTPLSGISSLEEVYEKASAPYKLLWPGKFVVFSPEQFISMHDGVIRTFPMKGTIDASIPDAEKMIMDDLKEQEEHATVVDLLRNDLSIVATKVTVDRYRFISKINTRGKTLLQTSSEISGCLADDYLDHLGDIINAVLPAGSVSGAPKKRTIELIHAIEPEQRGYYTGVFGVFDGEQVDSAVMIRMIEQRGDGFYYRSGGGITYRSEVMSEYQEMIDKVYIPG
jgi:para-aminobenzoate synthetase component I